MVALPFQPLCAFLSLFDLLCIVPICNAQRASYSKFRHSLCSHRLRFQQEDRPLIALSIYTHAHTHTYTHSIASALFCMIQGKLNQMTKMQGMKLCFHLWSLFEMRLLVQLRVPFFVENQVHGLKFKANSNEEALLTFIQKSFYLLLSILLC